MQRVKSFKYELFPLFVLLSTFPLSSLLWYIICLSKWKSGAGGSFSLPPLRRLGWRCMHAVVRGGMGGWRRLETQVTLSPGGEGEPALNVYRILPFLPPQREGPRKPAEAEVFGLPRSPSHVDQEVGDYTGVPQQPLPCGAGESCRCFFGWRAAI